MRLGVIRNDNANIINVRPHQAVVAHKATWIISHGHDRRNCWQVRYVFREEVCDTNTSRFNAVGDYRLIRLGNRADPRGNNFYHLGLGEPDSQWMILWYLGTDDFVVTGDALIIGMGEEQLLVDGVTHTAKCPVLHVKGRAMLEWTPWLGEPTIAAYDCVKWQIMSREQWVQNNGWFI
jgi:hypothetical protein